MYVGLGTILLIVLIVLLLVLGLLGQARIPLSRVAGRLGRADLLRVLSRPISQRTISGVMSSRG